MLHGTNHRVAAGDDSTVTAPGDDSAAVSSGLFVKFGASRHRGGLTERPAHCPRGISVADTP
jgi:hypothetical protein